MPQMNLVGRRVREDSRVSEPHEKPALITEPMAVPEKTVQEAAGRIVQLKHAIINERYLWDMRCWDNYHDENEISEWLDNAYEPNNCPSAVWCIQELFKLGVGREEIIDTMMQNRNRQFPHRIVKCFDNPGRCPEYRKHGNYSDCRCEQRCGGGIQWDR